MEGPPVRTLTLTIKPRRRRCARNRPSFLPSLPDVPPRARGKMPQGGCADIAKTIRRAMRRSTQECAKPDARVANGLARVPKRTQRPKNGPRQWREAGRRVPQRANRRSRPIAPGMAPWSDRLMPQLRAHSATDRRADASRRPALVRSCRAAPNPTGGLRPCRMPPWPCPSHSNGALALGRMRTKHNWAGPHHTRCAPP